MRSEDFLASNIALIHRDQIVAYLRDDFAHIPYPAYWDLPGGAREGNESAERCALRELQEEFGIVLDLHRIVWKRRYPHRDAPGQALYFMAAFVTRDEIDAIAFGEEGQSWALMPLSAFVQHDRAVPFLRDYVREFVFAGAGRRRPRRLHATEQH